MKIIKNKYKFKDEFNADKFESFINKYKFPKYYEEEIYRSYKNGFIMEDYGITNKFEYYQFKEIFSGLKSKVDVSIYCDTKYIGQQMREIRLGLKNGEDSSWYAKPHLSWEQMKGCREYPILWKNSVLLQ